VRMLDRKLVRDLRRMRGQILSIGAVVAGGVSAVVAMGSTIQSLGNARDAYYEHAHFAHVFASLKRAPESLADRIRAIPGVAAVETRVALGALLDVPGLPEPATAYVVSAPAAHEHAIGALHVRRGRHLDPAGDDEVLVNEHFFEANRLAIGDTLGAVINGRWERLRVVGVALSPEFVHNVAPGFGQFSDARHFAILWMNRDALGPLYGMDGAFNDVALTLAPGGSEEGVIAALDALLEPYGGGHAYGRDDQPSNVVVTGEMQQLRAFGVVMPAVFLFVAAFLINIVLSRLIATQREEVATLKAFGYSDRALAGHFLGYALAAVLAGALMGIPFGVWLGTRFTGLYAPYFRFPELEHHTSLPLVLVAIAVSGGAAVLGALGAVRAAVALPPAEGMRPPSPPVFRALLLERLGYVALLPPAVRMILRNIERRPLRSLASVIGVALSAAVVVGGVFAFDAARYIGRLQYGVVEREDVTVSFTQPRSARVRHELASLHGVRRVEPFRSVPVRLRHGHRSRQLAVTGLEPGGELRRIVDLDGRVYGVPPAGLVLTTTLGRTLHVSRGDTVTLELVERGGAERRVPVVALVDEMLGVAAYMDLAELNRLVGEGPTVSGAYLRVDSAAEADVLAALGRLPSVTGATTRRAMLASFEAQISESITTTTVIVTLLACVIAVGVLYNGARIALSERGRELASLRVLGFTRREVAALLLGEQAAINLAGTPLGLLLGLGLAFLIALGFDSELYRFPVIVTPRTYLSAAAVVAAAALVAGLAMRRRLNALDMVQVLKTRE